MNSDNLSKKVFAKEVEIGLMNRESGDILTAMVDKEDQIFMSIGGSPDSDEFSIYAFIGNVEIMRFPNTSSDATINRKFLKQFKLLKANTVKRFREEGKITSEKPVRVLTAKEKHENTLFSE